MNAADDESKYWPEWGPGAVKRNLHILQTRNP